MPVTIDGFSLDRTTPCGIAKRRTPSHCICSWSGLHCDGNPTSILTRATFYLPILLLVTLEEGRIVFSTCKKGRNSSRLFLFISLF